MITILLSIKTPSFSVFLYYYLISVVHSYDNSHYGLSAQKSGSYYRSLAVSFKLRSRLVDDKPYSSAYSRCSRQIKQGRYTPSPNVMTGKLTQYKTVAAMSPIIKAGICEIPPTMAATADA